MEAPDAKTLKSWGIILAIVIIIVLAIYFYGKKAGRTSTKPISLPTDQPGAPLSSEEATFVRQLSQELHDEMDGANTWSRDLDPHEAYAKTSDKLFVAVYNDFNKLYFAEGDGTLKEWYQDEYDNTLWGNISGGAFLSDARFGQLKEMIISRMQRLNLP